MPESSCNFDHLSETLDSFIPGFGFDSLAERLVGALCISELKRVDSYRESRRGHGPWVFLFTDGLYS